MRPGCAVKCKSSNKAKERSSGHCAGYDEFLGCRRPDWDNSIVARTTKLAEEAAYVRSLARRAKRGAPGLGPGDGGSLPGLHATSFGGQQINPAPLSTRRFCPSRGGKPAFGHQATLQEAHTTRRARAAPESACQHVGNRTTAVRKDFTGHGRPGRALGRPWFFPQPQVAARSRLRAPEPANLNS